jgi:hypothetical protein
MKTLLLFSGKLQSGKNTASSFMYNLLIKEGICPEYDMFARGVKEGCRKDFERLADYLNVLARELEECTCGKSIADKLKITDENWFENKTTLTRILLQIYGTDIFRDRVNKNYWIDQMLVRFRKTQAECVIVSDCRFPSEINYTMDNLRDNERLISIRINRTNEYNEMTNEHESEKALDSYDKFDYIIDNDSTLEHLEREIAKIAKEI